MKLSEELQARGFIYQCSAESLDEVLDGPKRTVYLGVDPTADAMHVGHLVPFMLLNHLLRAGHSVILLIGGGTALIGDPSGKDAERPFADAEEIAAQAAKLEENVRAITVGDVRFVNNHDWLSKLSMIGFLRDVGKHFTVNAMMKKESVSARLQSEQGISYTEFSYALLQAYDFSHLHETYGCDLQIGASDQWGNIVSGVDYIRRTTGKEVYGLTMPLVVNPATGKKFGKSEGNAVWLDAAKTSPFSFYQFWLNTPDDAAISYLRLFTFLPLEEIEEIAKDAERDPGARIAQRRLADEVTSFVHGAENAENVKRASEALFGATEFSEEAYALLRAYAPRTTVHRGTTVVEVLVASGLATSNREARTFIESGAITIGGVKVADAAATLDEGLFRDGIAILRRGKRQACLLELA